MKGLRPINKVMLIFPPFNDIRFGETIVIPPLGIAHLAAWVRDEVEVRLLDAVAEGAFTKVPISDKYARVGLPDDEIIRRVRRLGPDLVGFSCLFSVQFSFVRELARRIKAEVDPGIVVVAGGAHPSSLPERSMAAAELDYIVMGEGELTFRDLIGAHNNGKGVPDIDGLVYRENGSVRINPRKRLIEDLDSLPLPARDLLPIELYWKINVPAVLHYKKRKNLTLLTSRGCTYKCTFCASTIHWGKRRTRSPRAVLDEIRHLKEVHGMEEIKFIDDNLLQPPERARAIFQGMIDEGLTMPYNTPNGLNLRFLDADMVKLMKKSGCFEISLPVESGSPRTLEQIMHKPHKIEDARRCALLLRDHGLVSSGYFIIGLPGETMDDIYKTIALARELKLDYVFPFIYQPLPGTPLWDKCLEEGYISEDYDFENTNNFFQSDLDTDAFDSSKLEKMQRFLYILNNHLTLPFRNPRWFFDYYPRVLLDKPRLLAPVFYNLYHLARREIRRVLGGRGKDGGTTP